MMTRPPFTFTTIFSPAARKKAHGREDDYGFADALMATASLRAIGATIETQPFAVDAYERQQQLRAPVT